MAPTVSVGVAVGVPVSDWSSGVPEAVLLKVTVAPSRVSNCRREWRAGTEVSGIAPSKVMTVSPTVGLRDVLRLEDENAKPMDGFP